MTQHTPDEFAEIHGDAFYLNLSNDDARPGLVFLSLTAREDAVAHEGVPHFDLHQYLSVPEVRRLVNELNTVLARVLPPDGA